MGGIGEFVAQLRRKEGWTQSELAERSKGRLTQTYISKLEGGGIDMPTRGMMEALADVFNVPIGVLYRATGVLDGIDFGAGQPNLRLVTNDEEPPLDPEKCRAYVENYPDPEFVREALEVRRNLPYPDYLDWCVSICQAWRSNGHLAITAVKMGRP